MAHLPVNHPLRGFYRGLVFLVGAGLLAFGIVGYTKTSDLEMFARDGERVFFLTTNPAFSIASIVAGAVVLLGVLIGRNLDAYLNIGLGVVFMLAGLAMLTLIRTDSNVLASSIANVNVSFVVGTLLATAGMYGFVARR